MSLSARLFEAIGDAVVRARRAARGTLYTRGGVWERTLSITFVCRPRQSLRRAHRSEYAKHDSKTMRSNPCCNRAVITAEPNLSLQLTCHSITCSISTVPTTQLPVGGARCLSKPSSIPGSLRPGRSRSDRSMHKRGSAPRSEAVALFGTLTKLEV